MRLKAILFSTILGFALLAAIIVSASVVPLQEVTLSQVSEVMEINIGSDGRMFISHNGAQEIWRIESVNPSTMTYTVLENVGSVRDAKPDSLGNIWWSNGITTFGRISSPTLTMTTWQVPADQNVLGITIDDDDLVWLSGWDGVGSKLYNFDITSTQLCTFTLPPSTQSYYIAQADGAFWLGNRVEDRIFRVIPGASDIGVTWWDLPESLEAEPFDLAPTDDGDLWWTDQLMDALIFLETAIAQISVYTLPVGVKPQMLELHKDKVWYSESNNGDPGSVGVLDPAGAISFTAPLTTSSSTVTPECGLLEATDTSLLTVTVGSLSWTEPFSLTPIYDADGWRVYQMPADSKPFGLAKRQGDLFVTDQGRQKLLRLPIDLLGQLHLSLTTNITQAMHGDSIDYNYTVTYTSRDGSAANSVLVKEKDDLCTPISGPTGDIDGDNELDVDEIWRYTCSYDIPLHDDDELLPQDVNNNVTVSGMDASSEVVDPAEADATVIVKHDRGALNVQKTGPDSADHGQDVTYAYTVTYSSSDDAPAINLSIEDDHCNNISDSTGDSDEDDRLDVSETWLHVCQAVVHDHELLEADPMVNTVVVEVENFDGDKLTPVSDQHVMDIIHTAGELFVVKIGPNFARHGQRLTFSFLIVFENSDRSPAQNIQITDDKCSPVSYVSGDFDDDDQLDLNELWIYTCRYVVPDHSEGESRQLVNIVTVSARNLDGNLVAPRGDLHEMVIREELTEALFLPFNTKR